MNTILVIDSNNILHLGSSNNELDESRLLQYVFNVILSSDLPLLSAGARLSTSMANTSAMAG